MWSFWFDERYACQVVVGYEGSSDLMSNEVVEEAIGWMKGSDVRSGDKRSFPVYELIRWTI
jgi:hypothetical protein